jgi:hypothetical protein
LRGDATATFEWLDRAWSTRDAGIAGLLYDPFILRYKDDPRFAALPQGRAARAGRDEAADVISIRVGQEPPVQAIQRGTEVSPIAAGWVSALGRLKDTPQ